MGVKKRKIIHKLFDEEKKRNHLILFHRTIYCSSDYLQYPRQKVMGQTLDLGNFPDSSFR